MADRPMRTFKRQIEDAIEINKVLSANHIVRIGFNDADEGCPYILPTNYGYEFDLKTQKLIIYTHSAVEGRKIDLIKADNRVGFEIDEFWGIKQTPIACQWGMYYNSIIGSGKIYILEDDAERRRGLDIIMNKHGRYYELNYDENLLKRTSVLKIEVEKFRAKRYSDRTGTDEENTQIRGQQNPH